MPGYFQHSISVETVRRSNRACGTFWCIIPRVRSVRPAHIRAWFSLPGASNREVTRRGVTKTSATSTKSNQRTDIYFLLFRGNRAARSLFWIYSPGGYSPELGYVRGSPSLYLPLHTSRKGEFWFLDFLCNYRIHVKIFIPYIKHLPLPVKRIYKALRSTRRRSFYCHYYHFNIYNTTSTDFLSIKL